MSDTNTLRRVVEEADTKFRECHALLREPRIGPSHAEQLYALQGHLARAIYRIEEAILELKKEEKVLVGKKAGQPREAVHRQFRAIADHVKGLERAIDYGKVLGDAFAWLFYGSEEDLLRHHHAHEATRHLPVGIGGIGEVEFVANAPRIGDCLVIYHGITSFLRIGDVSLYNLTTGRIDGMAELKSKADGPNRVNISMNYVGKKPPIPDAPHSPARTEAEFRREVGDRFFSILQRQTEKISKTLAPARTNQRPEVGFTPARLDFDPSKLETLYDRATLEQAASVRVSPGLVLVGVKLPARTLAERIFNDAPWDAKSVIAGTMTDARTLLLEGSSDNAIVLNYLAFPRGARYGLRFGMKPLFWWPVRADVIDAIATGSFIVMTLFNPAHVIAKLRQRGYTLTSRRKGRGYMLEAPHGLRARISFPGLDYFLSLIPQELVSENSVVCMVDSMIEDLRKRNFTKPTHIDLQFRFRHNGDDQPVR